MSFCYFAYFRQPGNDAASLGAQDLRDIERILQSVAGLSRALIHTPVPADTPHPFMKDEAPPLLALQLYAPRVEILEQALRPDGALQSLAGPQAPLALQTAKCQQQVMLTRAFAPPGPIAPAGSRCSYLVHYPGHAENLNQWLTHYLDHHPQIMGLFQQIREIEIYTRVDWIGGLPGMRVDFMQRNKQVFDDPAALSAGLLSPVIQSMRKDYHSFPDFAGGNVHYPMQTREVQLPAQS